VDVPSLFPSPIQLNRAVQLSPAELRKQQERLLEACRKLAGTNGDCRFSASDAELGRALANTPFARWNPAIINTARLMLAKYTKQLGFSPLDIPPSPSEDLIDHQVAETPQKSARVDRNAAGEVVLVNGEYHVYIPQYPGKEFIQKLERMGGVFLKRKGYWRIHHNPVDAPRLAELLSNAGIVGQPGLYEALRRLPQRLAEREQKSKATNSTLVIDGIGCTPYPFQIAGVEYALESKRTFICDEPGLGKTGQALMLIHLAKAYPAIVICPASVVLNWLREVNKWIPDAYAVILHRTKYWSGMNADIMICTYGTFPTWGGDMVVDESKFHRTKKPPKKFQPGPLCDKDIRCLVVDESQAIKNRSARRTQVVLGFTQHCKSLEYRLLLTGTPLLNRPNELISQLDVLGRLQDFGGYHLFTQRYCSAYRDDFGLHTDGHASTSALTRLNAQLRAICFVRREKKDVLPELPDRRKAMVPLEITNRKEYDAAEADICAWCAQKSVEDEDFIQSIAHLSGEQRVRAIADRHNSTYWKTTQAEALVRIGKLRHLTAHGKFDGAMEWIENMLESDQKLILFAEHIDMQERYLAAILKNWGATHLFGSDTPKERQANVDEFQTNQKCRVIVCSLDAGNSGWTGTAASNVALTEFGWTPAKLDQAIQRAHRIGQKDSVTGWFLFADKTIDIDTLEIIDEKEKVTTAVTTGIAMAPTESILKELMKRLAAKGRS